MLLETKLQRKEKVEPQLRTARGSAVPQHERPATSLQGNAAQACGGDPGRGGRGSPQPRRASPRARSGPAPTRQRREIAGPSPSRSHGRREPRAARPGRGAAPHPSPTQRAAGSAAARARNRPAPARSCRVYCLVARAPRGGRVRDVTSRSPRRRYEPAP